MADGGMTIEVDEALARRLRALADAAGADVDDLVRKAVESYVDDWSEDLARLAEYERTGEAFDADAVLEEFHGRIAKALAERA